MWVAKITGSYIAVSVSNAYALKIRDEMGRKGKESTKAVKGDRKTKST